MQLFHNSIVACIGVADVGAPSATVVGACWQRIGDESRCSGLFQHNVTRAECCAGNQLHIGWTPYTIQTDLDYFQYVIVGKQASGCRPCKSTSPSYTVYTYKKSRSIQCIWLFFNQMSIAIFNGSIGVDLVGDATRAGAPNNWETPMYFHLFPQYVWQVCASIFGCNLCRWAFPAVDLKLCQNIQF